MCMPRYTVNRGHLAGERENGGGKTSDASKVQGRGSPGAACRVAPCRQMFVQVGGFDLSSSLFHAEKMLGRRLSTSYATPREELMLKMFLAPNIEDNLYTKELAIQVMV